MQTVAIVGPIDPVGQIAIREGLEPDFRVITVASEDEYDRLTDVSCLVLRTLTMRAEAIARCPELRLIQRWGVGYDKVDVVAAGRRGIQVAVTHGVNAVPVAEHTLLLTLAVLRRLLSQDAGVRQGKWQQTSIMEQTYTVRGKVAGLLGFGSIGRQVAHYLEALGAEIIYHDPFLPAESAGAIDNATSVGLEELAQRSDIVSLHAPLVDSTRGIIDDAFLASMKPTAVLINTARGGLVREEALCRALSEGRILGAGLDVYSKEPVDSHSALLGLDNVILTPHCAGNTADNSVRMAEACVANIRKVANGEHLAPPVLVNAAELEEVR